jgi:glucose/mannose-6-phosphate isomerase
VESPGLRHGREAAPLGWRPPLHLLDGAAARSGRAVRNGYLGRAPRRGVPTPTSPDTGPARMRALAASLPTRLKDGFRAGAAIAPSASSRPTTAYLVGMGGSGISSELARGLLEAETPLAVQLVRSPDLPRAVGRDSIVVTVSYSGTTWETLRAYDSAGRAKARRVAVTSGGTLAERAERDKVPLLSLPPGLPPRAAVGHILGGLLGLLDPWFPESNEARIDRVTARLESAIPGHGRASGPAARIADRVGDRVPLVYAESAFIGLARRWKTQIEENAKRLAFLDEIPELLHNALVGWDATERAEAGRLAVLILEWAEEAALTRRSIAYLERLVAARGATTVRVPLAAEDRLEALITGLSLGDHVSLFLADRRKVDPYPVEAIGRLKTTLATRGAR